MADTDDNVNHAISVIKEQDYSTKRNPTDEAITEIKASVIFQMNWPQLLGAAPTAISATGLAYLAASSEFASRVQLAPRKDGYKFLKWSSLNGNLIQSGDLGRTAFSTAETNMAEIKSISAFIPGKVRKIINDLLDPEDAKASLKGDMLMLQKWAQDCLGKVREIDTAFEDWLKCITELHQACVDTESSNQEKLDSTKINMAVAQTLYDKDKDTTKEAKEAADEMKNSLKLANEAYKAASDNFPSGWDLVGQEIVGKLADTLITAGGQLLKGYAESQNPMLAAEDGMKLFEEADRKGPKPTPPAKQQSTDPKTSKDPAYVDVNPALVYLNSLNALLFKGQGGGVNWEEVSDATDHPSNSAQYISQMLVSTFDSFKKKATEEAPSQELLGILNTSITVINGIKNIGGNNSLKDLPKPDSKEVKDWQGSFQPQYEIANQLAAVAKSLPGATNKEGLMAVPPQTDAAKNKPSVAQSYLAAAQDRLHRAQDSFLATQKNYLQARDALVTQQDQLAEAKAKIQKLTNDFKSLTQVKSVLIHCIALIMTVKQKVSELTKFFDAISKTVEVIVEQAVGDFLETIENSVSNDPERRRLASFPVGPYVLTDLQRTYIYKSGILVEAYFAVFGDVAGMWDQLAQRDLSSGLELLDKISLSLGPPDDTNKKNTDKDRVADQVQQLTEWEKKTSHDIQRMARDAESQIMDSIEGRVERMKQITKTLPASPATAAAIDRGSKVVTTAAANAIRANSENSPLSMFLPSV